MEIIAIIAFFGVFALVSYVEQEHGENKITKSFWIVLGVITGIIAIAYLGIMALIFGGIIIFSGLFLSGNAGYNGRY